MGYGHFLERVLERGNQGRREKLAQELAVMKLLPPTRLSEYDEVSCTVSWPVRFVSRKWAIPSRRD